jgi:hypothetical protein
MDVREKLGELLYNSPQLDVLGGLSYYEEAADHLIANGVTVQEWISVKERTPTEADGTVWVCLADVFPYNEKEPYIDAKHDRRITEAFYSQFSKRWYKDGAVLPDGVVTHWMEKPQPPKGE